jgi:hypothetical protein
MKICIYANCQSIGIKKFLQTKLDKTSEIVTILNYEKLINQTELEYNAISKCDLFIYQHISKAHGIYSTDFNITGSVVNYLRQDCMKIAVPFVYDSSLWSMFEEGDNIINKEVIIDLKNNGYSLCKIIDMYNKFELDFRYKARSVDSKAALKEKEKVCDIKVIDFINEELGNLKLFLTQNHPTSAIFTCMVNQILNLIGIQGDLNYKNFDENYSKLPGVYKYNKYDIKYWNFKYATECDGDEWTKELIKKSYGS